MSTLAADVPAADPAPRKPMPLPVHPVIAVLRPLASLRLTVALFAMSVVLVFFGTVAQKNAGIWGVVDQYFWSWYVLIDAQLLVQFGQIFFDLPRDWSTTLQVPFPAGKSIGWAMFINLLAAHTLQLVGLVRLTSKQAKRGDALGDVVRVLLKRSGIYVLHGGILLLFAGEYITREFQVEQHMRITEGGSADYASDTRNHELAFLSSAPGSAEDRVTVVPIRKLREAMASGAAVSDPALPVDVEVVELYKNSELIALTSVGPNQATAGSGLSFVAVPRPEGKGTDSEQKLDAPAAYVRFKSKPGGEDLGVYLVSSLFTRAQPGPAVGGVQYAVQLRGTRHYKPFRLDLLEATHETYMGTMTPKNFASRLRLSDPDRGADRELTISMNDPLRYRGETYFQSGMNTPREGGPKETVLQVVRNPGWVLPYAACAMVTIGMVLHFTIGLVTFVMAGRGRSQERPTSRVPFASSRVRLFAGPLPVWGRRVAWGSIGLTALYLLTSAYPRTAESKYDLATLGSLPVVKEGRVKPLDTVASVILRQLNTTEEYRDETDKKRPAIEWYLKAMTAAPGNLGPTENYQTFRVENDRLWEMMKLEKRYGLRYSVKELKPQFDALEAAAKKSDARLPAERDLFDNKVLELHRHLGLHLKVLTGMDALILPPAEGREWREPGAAMRNVEAAIHEATMAEARARIDRLGLPLNPAAMSEQQRQAAMQVIGEVQAEEAERLSAERDRLAAADPDFKLWLDLQAAYREKKPDEFNRLLGELSARNNAALTPKDCFRVKLEHYLNQTAFYYKCIGLYIFAFLLTAVGVGAQLVNPGVAEGFRRGAFGVLLLTCLVHTATLFARMYLMDRPLVFVTNLYSSAVFIGWAAVIGSLLVERVFSIGLGNAVGSAVGFGTCVVAHQIAADGDTLKMMEAVLDTNFWLATHVTTVTLGYAATYVAGLIGLIYVVLGILTPYLRSPVNVTMGGGAKSMELGRVIGMVMYGVVCFAVLFSFVGTVLGGIWADQSWGRFWGWDPKENGAVLIVIWNALILHARWAGLVKDRGVAVLALVGNMITTWSWFGTNQLGVGLHAYGFNQELQQLCEGLWLVHGCLVVAALTPKHIWASFATTAKAS